MKTVPLTLATVSSATYGSTPLQVKPNQCVSYRLTIKNEGATPASNIVINDIVPAYSHYVVVYHHLLVKAQSL